MAMNTQTQTFRGFCRAGELNAQTAVECRFGGEVETVLSVHAAATLSGAEAEDGAVRYFGKVLFSVVYEDAEKRVCRAEKGVEFSARAQDASVTPALTVRGSVSAENVTVRREGASVYVTALLGADLRLYGEREFAYLTGGDLIARREPVRVLCAHLCGGETEAEDEFETDIIGDVLFHAETVFLSDVSCEAGLVRAEGEINLGVLALKGGNALVSFERMIPFRAEIPCEQASASCRAEVHVTVGNAVLKAEADEEKATCRILVQLSLAVDACVYEEVTVDAVTDAFASDRALRLSRLSAESRGAGERFRIIELISGKAALSSAVDFSDTLQAVTLSRAEGYLAGEEGARRAEGAVMATLLVLGADGSHRGVEVSLPFSVPVQAEGECRVNVLVCGMSARQRREGEIEAEATLKIALTGEAVLPFSLVTAAEEGEAIARSDSAVSILIPDAGDGLWELAKRLGKAPEEVAASNPGLEFPVREGQRVIIYRKMNRSV